jgi:hypothetical protein
MDGQTAGGRMLLCRVSTPSTGIPWESVGISAYSRGSRGVVSHTPTVEEIEHVRDIFWGPDELVLNVIPGKPIRDTIRPGWVYLWLHPDLAKAMPSPWPTTPPKGKR